MKKLLLTAVLFALGSATQMVADETSFQKEERIYCARRTKDLKYDNKNADCFELCKSKGNWNGKAKLSRDKNKNIVCICGNGKEVTVDCTPSFVERNVKGMVWNGDFYSAKLPGDGMITPDAATDKLYDGKAGRATDI